MLKKILNLITLFALPPFFLVVGFGLSHSWGMEMKEDGTMAGCIFDRQAAICPMTFAEHISRWQGLFTAIPQKSASLIQFLVLLSALVFAALALRRRWLTQLFSYFPERWKLYLKYNPHLLLFDRQRQLFSQGILNPKIYDRATL